MIAAHSGRICDVGGDLAHFHMLERVEYAFSGDGSMVDQRSMETVEMASIKNSVGIKLKQPAIR